MTQQTLKPVHPAAFMTTSTEPGLLQRFIWNFTDTYVVMRRNLMYYVRQPQLLIFSTIQPVMFLLLFTYVFGGAISFSTGGNYINFLMPGIIIQSIIFAATNTTIGLSVDLSRGMIDRFRSLPMSRAAVLGGADGRRYRSRRLYHYHHADRRHGHRLSLRGLGQWSGWRSSSDSIRLCLHLDFRHYRSFRQRSRISAGCRFHLGLSL